MVLTFEEQARQYQAENIRRGIGGATGELTNEQQYQLHKGEPLFEAWKESGFKQVDLRGTHAPTPAIFAGDPRYIDQNPNSPTYGQFVGDQPHYVNYSNPIGVGSGYENATPEEKADVIARKMGFESSEDLT